MKKDKVKNSIIEQLKKMPIVQIACEKIGIGRATYYRWRKESKKFTEKTDTAITEGELLINDMSETQTISLIREKSWPAINFWLRYHHPKYSNKVEITTKFKESDEKLTPEQEAIVRKAFQLVSYREQRSSDYQNHDQDANKGNN